MSADGLPRPARIAAGTLALAAIAIAATGRLTGRGGIALEASAPVAVRALRFDDGTDGSVTVRDARDASVVRVLAPGDGGFVRGTLRALARGRRQRGIGADVPMVLTQWRDGRLTLDDSTTGAHVELTSFGATNTAAFARLLAGG